MGLAQNIEALLVKFEISAEGLACRVGVSPATVSRWRSGMGMRQSTIRRVCDAFELEPDALLSDSRGLAATMFGDVGNSAAKVPLVSADEALARKRSPDKTCARLGEAEACIEVPRFVAQGRPAAFAITVGDESMGRVIPRGANIVVDPEAKPASTSIVAVALETNAVAVHPVDRPLTPVARAEVTLRRYVKGNQTVVLATEAADDGNGDDLVLPEADASDRVIGTVVWFQAADLLG